MCNAQRARVLCLLHFFFSLFFHTIYTENRANKYFPTHKTKIDNCYRSSLCLIVFAQGLFISGSCISKHAVIPFVSWVLFSLCQSCQFVGRGECVCVCLCMHGNFSSSPHSSSWFSCSRTNRNCAHVSYLLSVHCTSSFGSCQEAEQNNFYRKEQHDMEFIKRLPLSECWHLLLFSLVLRSLASHQTRRPK